MTFHGVGLRVDIKCTMQIVSRYSSNFRRIFLSPPLPLPAPWKRRTRQRIAQGNDIYIYNNININLSLSNLERIELRS